MQSKGNSLIISIQPIFPIASTLQTQLNCSQYKLLMSIDNDDKRTFILKNRAKIIGRSDSWSDK